MGVAWGIVSTAEINRLVLAGARESELVDIVGVASRDARKAEDYAREHGIERAYGSYEALLADDDIEAVYISLPNSMHVDWSVRCLEAGKHVLCEKPLSRNPAEAKRVFDVAERVDRLLSEAFMYRHNPQTHRLKQLVDEGAIGALKLVRSAFSFTVDGPENIRMLPDLDGGSLMDVGCYCVNGSRMLAGEPLRVYGEQQTSSRGLDLRFAGTMRFRDEVVAQFDCGFNLQDRDELEVIGESGSLFLDDPWHARDPVIELRRPEGEEMIRLEPVNSYRLELENLSAAIRGGARPLLGRADATAQARVLDALYRSAGTAARVDL